ncbi:MAG: hypothetical protein AB4352_12500 [Hormoscilla sp.]
METWRFTFVSKGHRRSPVDGAIAHYLATGDTAPPPQQAIAHSSIVGS